jgi:hypothetical protein
LPDSVDINEADGDHLQKAYHRYNEQRLRQSLVLAVKSSVKVRLLEQIGLKNPDGLKAEQGASNYDCPGRFLVYISPVVERPIFNDGKEADQGHKVQEEYAE